jgi:hypothetical protein
MTDKIAEVFDVYSNVRDEGAPNVAAQTSDDVWTEIARLSLLREERSEGAKKLVSRRAGE